MIKLIRLDGVEILLNIELIQRIEAGEPTIIFLSTGESVAVKNSHQDIVDRIKAQRAGQADSDSDDR